MLFVARHPCASCARGEVDGVEQAERGKGEKSAELPRPSERSDCARLCWTEKWQRNERSDGTALKGTEKQRMSGKEETRVKTGVLSSAWGCVVFSRSWARWELQIHGVPVTWTLTCRGWRVGVLLPHGAAGG